MKKRLLIAMVFTLSAALSFAQSSPTNSPLNAYTQKIVYAQIAKSIGMKFPLVVGFGGFVYAANVKIVNDRIYYSNEVENMSNNSALSKVGMNEMKDGLKVKFTRDSISNRGFLLNAYVNERLSVRLKYENDGKTQQAKMESPSSKRSKVDLYENNKLVSSAIAKKNKIVTVKNIQVNAQFASNPLYSSLLQKGNQELSSITALYKTDEFAAKNIIRVQHHFVNKNNQLSKVISMTGDLKVTDSTTFTYKDELLTGSKNYIGKHFTTTDYQYDSENRPVNKPISADKKHYALNYAYDNTGHLSNVNIKSDEQDSKKFNIDLLYNADGNLISVTVINKLRMSKKDKLKNQYNFSYDKNKNINRLWQLNRRGKVKKEIEFVSELL